MSNIESITYEKIQEFFFVPLSDLFVGVSDIFENFNIIKKNNYEYIDIVTIIIIIVTGIYLKKKYL